MCLQQNLWSRPYILPEAPHAQKARFWGRGPLLLANCVLDKALSGLCLDSCEKSLARAVVVCNELCYCLSILVLQSTQFLSITMQFYSTHPNVAPGRHPEYGYPTGPVATSPRINWSPTMHPGAWPPYDFTAAYPAAYPPTSADPAQRSPPYQVSSPNDHSGTPHNIRDILGGQQQGTLLSEIAKTPSSYQKSPTSTAVSGAMTFSEQMRSPTTPTVPPHGIVYSSEVPSSFYVPRPLPGSQFAFDSCVSICLRELGLGCGVITCERAAFAVWCCFRRAI